MTAVAAWSIWGQDMFPKEGDPIGGELNGLGISFLILIFPLDPETWTREELRRWLAAVGLLVFSRKMLC